MEEAQLKALEWFDRGVQLERLGRHEEAIAAFDSAIAMAPGLAFPWYVRGNALYELGHYADAIDCYHKVLELDPEYADAWNNLGLSAFKLGHYSDALAAFDQAVAHDPSNAFSWNNRGVALQIQKKNEEAIDAFDHAAAIDPDYTEPLVNKSHALMALRRYTDAISTYSAILRLNPRNAQVWHDKGEAQALTEQHEGALESFNQALEIEPKNTRILVQKAKTLYTLQRYQDAIAELDRVLAIDGSNVSSWEAKGLALTRLHKYREALAAFDHALSFEPSSSQALSGRQFAQKKVNETTAGKSLRSMIFHRQVLVQWGTLIVLIILAIIIIPVIINSGYLALVPVSTGPSHPTAAMSPPEVCAAVPAGGFYMDQILNPVPIIRTIGDWSFTLKPVAHRTIIGRVASKESYLPVPPGECSPFDLTIVNGEMMDKTTFRQISLTNEGRRVFYKTKLPQSATQLGQVYLNDHILTFHLVVADATVQNVTLQLSPGDVVMITGYEVDALGSGPNGATRHASSSPGSPEQSLAASVLMYVESIRVLPC